MNTQPQPQENRREREVQIGTDTDARPAHLRVTCGANTQELERMFGYTVGDVRRRMTEVLNVPRDAKAYMNGTEVGDTAILEGNEELEFRKPAGQKG